MQKKINKNFLMLQIGFCLSLFSWILLGLTNYDKFLVFIDLIGLCLVVLSLRTEKQRTEINQIIQNKLNKLDKNE